MRLSIETNFQQVQQALATLQKDIAAKATARALNRAIEQARTQMSREIRSEFVVDARFVRERLRIKRATFFGGTLGLVVTLGAESKPRSANVIRFGARQNRQGVSVKISRKGGRQTIRNVFIGNKGRTVFERVPGTKMNSRPKANKHGEQIRPVQTINVPQMFNTRRINAAVVAALQARFPAIFERELAFALGAFNGGR